MRLLELAFKSGGQSLRVGLTGAHHCVIAPPELPLEALREGICAAFYGAEQFPVGAQGSLRNAGVAFEANGLRYRVLVDLTNGRRLLVREGGGAPEVIADQPGAISQALTSLLHLPSPLVYRSLMMVDAEFPSVRLPKIPAGTHRALLAHALAPEVLRAEHRASLQQVEAARVSARRPSARAPWQNPTVLATGAAGLLTLVMAAVAPGAGRMAGLAAPLLFGVAAWRALQWVDTTEERTHRLRGLDEAEAVARVRRRHVDELDQTLLAVERAVGSKNAERVAAALNAATESAPAKELQQHVEIYAGHTPDASTMSELAATFGHPGAATTSAGLILAALLARGQRAAPMLWLDAGVSDDGIAWDRVFDRLADEAPLLVFRHRARTVDRPVTLEAARPPAGSV